MTPPFTSEGRKKETGPGDRITKERLDKLLVTRGLAGARQEAQALIMAGKVIVDGRKIDKAGTTIPVDAGIQVTGGRRKYVSRGGLKLEAALDAFDVTVTGRSAVDVGASTGGFTDCLLQRGAQRICCIDVGYGQLAEKLRRNTRVSVLDRFNARNLTEKDLPWPCNLAVVDVSFIPLKLIIPPLAAALEPGAEIIALVKPQFEVGRGKVGKGGIVRDAAARDAAVDAIEEMAHTAGLFFTGRIESPITGADGNVEYLIHIATPRNS